MVTQFINFLSNKFREGVIPAVTTVLIHGDSLRKKGSKMVVFEPFDNQ